METVGFHPSCLRIATAPCWKTLSCPLATPLQHPLLLPCKSLDLPRSWESPLLQFENLPPVRCLPVISAELAAVLGTLPQAGLADPRRRTAPPAASCPSAGCRCRRWAQSTSSALSCEQASGHPIRRGRSCCVATPRCVFEACLWPSPPHQPATAKAAWAHATNPMAAAAQVRHVTIGQVLFCPTLCFQTKRPSRSCSCSTQPRGSHPLTSGGIHHPSCFPSTSPCSPTRYH